ncbi:MAG TPA: hypothetical protein VFI31_25675 [Pirellulales bacterium]|nr:hypothetical protein [Pirellulales bacterium]
MREQAGERINPVVMEIETDPATCAEVARRMDLFERNWSWLEAHASEVYSHRGKFLCISGQELFVGDTVEEVLRAAKAAHPDDDGRFTRYIPKEKGPRIYAY